SHGSRTNNLPSGSGAGEAPGAPLPFDLDAEFVGQVTELFDFFGGGDGTAQGQPYFQVIAHRDIPDLVVTLNGRVLALMETADVSIGADPQFFHKFALDSADIAALAVAGNVVDFQYTGDPAEFVLAGVTTGSMSNAIPEPATLSLLALGGLAVLRRRRKR
ncbi:MAG: PEP-CTERM sorting domain-containing protein, partial [Phycisphaerae bacterium]|nr:PEP-CTERM sorting domain-containing protein [Phycisphaerae bacterium]